VTRRARFVISGLRGCLLCFVTAGAGILVEADADAWLARWWLWVFIGPDTACFVMDPSRSGAVLAAHAGIDGETGQLAADGDAEGPRQLVISSDF
jgi:hypothetical protein